ncbi:MAG TPA: AMP-binding protein, partial [Gemmatimonadales bacterium]|nr:AMP-binding protein [Gemmatimonadales bacterium]
MAATASTLTELLFGALDRFESRPVAMRAKQGGDWIELSYRDLADRIQDLSVGLLELGVSPGDRVAILSENRPEWAIADYACLAACCTDVPIYPTLPARQVEHNLSDSGAVAVLVSTPTQLEKVLQIRQRLPRLRYIIGFDSDVAGPGVLSLKEVFSMGRASRSAHLTWRDDALRVRPDDL